MIGAGRCCWTRFVPSRHGPHPHEIACQHVQVLKSAPESQLHDRWRISAVPGDNQDLHSLLQDRLPPVTETLDSSLGLDDGEVELDWRSEIDALRGELGRSDGRDGSGSDADEDILSTPERVYLVGVSVKRRAKKYGYSIHESLEELGRLAETAGLEVVGSTFQQLDAPSSRTYIGSGKVQEIAAAVAERRVDTIIFDDELSPGQQRSLERLFGDEVRLCDRTALILDIFSQRAATREGQLQVELATSAYELPRLKKMWSHLERQAGGRTKGMGEKQIEVDKRILRNRMAILRKELDEVRLHRKMQRTRRAEATVPVIGLCGYTNSGKSTLLNRMTDSDAVLAEDALFATLDPTTRRIELASGKQALLTDTVGFIQKLPTQLVAAFRATLEEIGEATLLLHVVDVSSPNAAAQTDTVNNILEELDIKLPIVTVWNKVDLCANPDMVRQVAASRPATVCISALTGEGIGDLAATLEQQLSQQMSLQTLLIPFNLGDIVSDLHEQCVVTHEEYCEQGTRITAYIPHSMTSRLQALREVNGSESRDSDESLLGV